MAARRAPCGYATIHGAGFCVPCHRQNPATKYLPVFHDDGEFRRSVTDRRAEIDQPAMESGCVCRRCEHQIVPEVGFAASHPPPLRGSNETDKGTVNKRSIALLLPDTLPGE